MRLRLKVLLAAMAAGATVAGASTPSVVERIEVPG